MSFNSKKHILITGGSKGIGSVVSRKLIKEGFHVSIFARNQNILESLKTSLSPNEQEQVSLYACDVSKEEAVSKNIKHAIKNYGAAHALICCAGIHGPLGKFCDTQSVEWEEAFKVNVFGSMYALRAVYPSMKKQGHGHVVFFSGGGQAAMPGFSAYVGSKGSIWRITETLAAELKEDNIMVNAIAPGAVDTGLQDQVIAAGPAKVTEDYFKQIKKIKKSGGTSPDYAANLCAYLVSEQSLGLSGKTLSARWDKPEEFENKKEISNSDLFTYKRVINKTGGTRF